MEVDTPALGQYAITDPNIELFEVSMGDSSRFLQSSPEYAMKRLLAFGSGDIYQLGKVFRSGEHGRKHNPEFAMLEWYRTQWTHYRLMREVADLICPILNLDSWQVWSIEALFDHFCQINPHDASIDQLQARALELGVEPVGDLEKLDYVDLLMTHVVEPGITDWGLVFVTDFLMEQAALSRLIDRGDKVVAARFEAFVGGVELANGYWEELNPETLRQRFESDNAVRRQRGQATRDIDPRFMHAMNAGLPDCSGVALGFDRLLMLAQGHTDMSTILPFTWSQA